MTDKKKEYHKRVSPMVRIGGRSKSIHMPTMKARKTSEPIMVIPKAPLLRPLKAKAAPTIQHKADTRA